MQNQIPVLGGMGHGTMMRLPHGRHQHDVARTGPWSIFGGSAISGPDLQVDSYKKQRFRFTMPDYVTCEIEILVLDGMPADELLHCLELVYGRDADDCQYVRHMIRWPGEISPGGEYDGVVFSKDRRAVPIEWFRLSDRFTEYGPEDLYLLEFFGIARRQMVRCPPTVRFTARELERIEASSRSEQRAWRRAGILDRGM